MNDIPVSVIIYLKENVNKNISVFRVKCMLMNGLSIRGKEAKKYAKWHVNKYLNASLGN